MSEFNVIECGFNIADETINFGSRMLAEGDHLFEACTLASIKQSHETQRFSNVNIQACSYGNKLYYSVDKSIGIFSDLSCTELCFNTSFDECVDEFCITPDSKSLLVCLRNGTVLYIDTEKQEIIFNEELIVNGLLEEKFFIGSFIRDYSKEQVDFFIITKTGSVYRVIFDSTANNSEISVVKEFQFKITTSAMIYPYLFVDGESMAVHDFENDDTIEDEPLNLVKVCPYSSEMFIGLDSQGNLIRICSRTGLLFYIKCELKFKNFLYTNFSISESHSMPYYLCVTFQNDIQLYDTHPVLSDLKFSLHIGNDIQLISPGNIDDESMFISVIQKGDVIEELRLQVISETAPEVRLKRLLRRQQFDEAEKFANQYNLSNVEVLKAKAQVIVDKRTCTRDDICNLLNVLDRIDDTLFKLESCIDTYLSCENLNDVQKLLLYGCNSVVQHNVGKDISDLHRKMSDIMFRFDTFKLIQKLDVGNINWLEFHDCDIIKLLCEYLQKYKVDIAIILYNRLDKDTIMELDEATIYAILNLLNNLLLEVYRPFLYCFIPLSLSYLPTTLPLFVKWLTRKVYFIEQNNSNEFPENAIEFTDDTLQLMKVDSGNLNFQQQHTVNREATHDLAHLVKALKTVQILKDTYQIIMPLKEYLKGPEPFIQTLLALDLDDDLFDKFLGDFLCKFMLENDLEPDTIFLEAIQNIVQYEESYWSRIIPSLLKNIRSIEVKLTAVMNLIEVAAVPWSPTMKEITRNSLEYRHELAQAIKKEIENEPLYRILKKSSYNLQDVSINNMWDIEHVIGRIMYCNEPTMIDDIYQLCKTNEQRHTANVMLISRFIKMREFDRALEILDNNSPCEIKNCCLSLIQIMKWNDQMKLFNRNKPYLDILGCLEKRLKDSDGSINKSTRSLIRNISICSQIRTSLYDKIEIEDLESPLKKQILLHTLLSNIHQDLYDGNLDPIEAVESCKKIAGYLNESKQQTLIKFSEILNGNFKIIEECATFIYDNEKNSKRLCSMAVLILKSICPTVNADDLLNTTSMMNETMVEPGISIETQMRCLRIAQNLTTKAILHADRGEINSCIEVFNWAMSTVYMTMKSSTMEKSIFSDTSVAEITLPSMRSLYCIKHIVNSYISFFTSHVNPDLKYLTYFELTEDQLIQEGFSSKINQLPLMIQNFCLEGQTLTAFKLILTLKDGLRHSKNINANYMKTINTITKQCITRLLEKVFRQKQIDTELAYGLLISCELYESISFLNRQMSIHKKQIAKFKVLAYLALRILDYHKINTKKQFYLDIFKLVNWRMRIVDCQISLKNFFNSPKAQLLESLIHHRHVDLRMIGDFCQDFQLEVQHYYQVYLKKSLLNWKPEYDKVEDVSGKVMIDVKTSEDQLFERCNEVVNLLKSKEAVYDFINSFRHEVNFYHYEVFFTIFSILGNLNKNKDYKKKLLLLHFLKTYRRINKPSDSEIEEWYTLFPDSQSVDPLSQWRMPFTPTLFSIDIWKIIRPELNLQTYEIWFEVIPILNKILNKDEICSYVIKEIVSRGILQKDASNRWLLHPLHDHLFEQIDKCVQNMSSLEMATSAVYQLVMHTTKGADQVNAAKLCLKYAIRYKESGPENDPGLLKAFIKIEKKYQSFAATHILHLCQINVEKYSDILLEPNELIDALYMDESIIKRADRVLLNCPDINKAVDELGVLFNINIHQTRLKLLENWLSERISINFDATMTSTNNLGFGEGDTNSINLKRAAYICQSEDMIDWQIYLLERGYRHAETKNIYYKANALNCFIVISDVSTIEEFTEKSFDDFRNYVDKLYLLSDLEYLGLTMTIETLDNYKKSNLLRRLAQDVYNPITIKTMAALCMIYVEYDLKFWQIIITTAINLNLVDSLKKYVHFLKNEPAFKYKKFYIEAWQNVIDQSFNVDTTDTNQLYNICLENMLVIQSCPVLLSLNFVKVFNKCCGLKMYEFAAIVVQYLSVEEQKLCIERVIRSKKNIGLAVSKLSDFGIWGTAQVQRLLKSD